MLQKILNPFKQEEQEYESPFDTNHIHTILCTCGDRRCFGYTPIRWRRELSIK